MILSKKKARLILAKIQIASCFENVTFEIEWNCKKGIKNIELRRDELIVIYRMTDKYEIIDREEYANESEFINAYFPETDHKE